MVAWLVAFTLCAFAGEETLGEEGGTVELPPGWARTQLGEDAVGDQFSHPAGLYMLALENRGVWLDEADARRYLDVLLEAPQNLEGSRRLGPIQYEEKGGVGHAWQSWRAPFRGMDLVFEYHAIGGGGLGYSITTWSGASKAEVLASFTEDLAERIRVPDALATLEADATVSARFGRHEARLRYPSAILREIGPENLGDSELGVGSHDGSMDLYLLVRDDEVSAEQALEDAAELSRDWFTRIDAEVDIRKQKAAGRKGTGLVIQGVDDQGQLTQFLAAIPVEETGDVLDIRMSTRAPRAEREDEWQALLDGLELEILPPLDAFPESEDTVEDDPTAWLRDALPDARARLLRKGTREGVYEGRASLDGPEPVLSVVLSDRVEVVDLRDGSVVEVPTELGYSGRVVQNGPDGVLILDKDGNATRWLDGEAQPAGWSATRAVPVDGGLVLVRSAQEQTPPGLQGSYRAGTSLHLREGGDERPLAQLLDVTYLSGGSAAGKGGRGVLLSGNLVDREGVVLLHLDPDSGATRELGVWDEVQDIGVAPGGWTVQGAPAPGEHGVYHVIDGEDPALLVSGRHHDALLTEDHLWLVTSADLDDEHQWKARSVHRLPRARVEAHGAAFDPRSVARIEAVAREAFPVLDAEAVFADADSIRAAGVRARQAWEAAGLGPFPATAEGIDEVAYLMTDAPVLDPATELWLGVVATDHLLSAGAEWVESEGPAEVGTMEYRVTGGLFASGYLPRVVLRSALSDSEGWYDPVQSMAQEDTGRRIVLGTRLDAVHARVEALDPGLPDVAEASPETLAALLAAHPDNTAVRDRIVERLTIAGRQDVVRDLLAPAVAGEAPEVGVLVRYYSALDQLGGDVQARIEGLRAVIADHPRAAGLYVLLGRAWEASDAERARERAAACFDKALSLVRYGSLAAQATEGLKRVGEAP